MVSFTLPFIIIKVLCPRAGHSLQTQAPKAAVLSKGRSSTANSGTKVAVLLGINRYGSSPLLSAPHSLLSIWTYFKDLKRSQGPQSEVREWICLTGSSGIHRNSPQGLNISSIRIFDRSEIRKSPCSYRKGILCTYCIQISQRSQ